MTLKDYPREAKMDMRIIEGEPWTVEGKEIVPLLRTIRFGPRKAGKGTGEYAFAWLRPAGFLVREDRREEKVGIPIVNSSGPIMLVAAIGLFVFLLIIRILAGRLQG
jgi:hypothetical protein